MDWLHSKRRIWERNCKEGEEERIISKVKWIQLKSKRMRMRLKIKEKRVNNTNRLWMIFLIRIIRRTNSLKNIKKISFRLMWAISIIKWGMRMGYLRRIWYSSSRRCWNRGRKSRRRGVQSWMRMCMWRYVIWVMGVGLIIILHRRYRLGSIGVQRW